MNNALGALTVNGGTAVANDVTGLLTVDGAATQAQVNNVLGNAELANGATLTVSGNITGTTNGAGILVLNGMGAGQTVTGAVGNVTPLTNIKFAGKDVTFASNTLNADNVDFSTDEDGITITTTGVDLDGININKSGNGVGHKIIVSGPQTFTGNIVNFGSFVVNGASTVNIDTANFAAGLKASAPNQVSLIVSQDITLPQVGDEVNYLKDVDFQSDAKVTGDTFAGTAKIGIGDEVTFGGKLTANTLTLAGAGSKANFADGAMMNSAIAATAPGEGIVNFAGSVDVKKAIGHVKEVNFDGVDRTKVVKLAQDIGGKTKFGKSSVALENNVKMTAGATFDGTEVDLGTEKLTISGGNVKLTGAVDFKTTLSGNSVGNVELNVGAANTIDLTGLTSLTITVDDSAATENGVNTYTLLTTKSGTITGFDASKITDGNPDNDFVRWTVYSDPSGKITLVSTNQTGKSLEQTFEKLNISKDLVSSELLNMFNNAEEGTQGFDFRNELKKLSDEDKADTIIRLVNNTAVSNTEVISDALNDATSQISTRISSLITPMAFTAPTPAGGSPLNAIEAAFDDALPMSGVAAGDSLERHGVWASPFYSENTQKKRGASAGHKARSSGLTAGFDTMATDDMIVGAAGTFINTNVSHKDFKKGDKTKVDSLMFTVYGVQQMANDWYVQGVANFGSSRVKNSEGRGGVVKQVAKGNYTSMSFSGEVLGGYNYLVGEQAVVTPMAGLGYSNSNDSSYRESGTTNQNLDITKRASHKIEGILGARAATMPYDVNGMAISPEAHLYVRHDMTGKSPKVDVRLDGIGLLSSKSTKAARTFVTLGTSVSAKYSMMDYGIGYDATMATKYIGHQGTVKVRVNF
jgi:outer membrane autotransporter protein